MSYLVLNPTCNALMKQLREMDRQRDHLRAQLADAAMRAEMEEISKDSPSLWMHPSVRQARMEAMAEKIGKREARRAKEMERFGAYVRPGTWDADLDEYQEPKYEEDVGDGYKIRLVRARDLTWNAYVILPEGHCAIGKHYDFFGGYEAPQGLPRPPQNLTYGGVCPRGDSWDHAEVGVYGFYLTNIVKPREEYAEYQKHDHFSVEETGASYVTEDGSKHYSYHKMRKLCLELVEYFKGLAADPKTVAICREARYCREHSYYYVGKCTGCEPPPPTEAKPAVKKSWAAVAAGK